MNKQELIECYERVLNFVPQDEQRIYRKFVEKLKELDEPQKVTVPQFVADWIEECKGKDEPLYYALDRTPPQEVDSWFCEDEVKRQNTFARAWLDGYEVEKEMRYLVKMKGFEEEYNFLNYFINTKLWIIQSNANNSNYRTHHTRKELEQAGFGWVFDCEGIEIEEVKNE